MQILQILEFPIPLCFQSAAFWNSFRRMAAILHSSVSLLFLFLNFVSSIAVHGYFPMAFGPSWSFHPPYYSWAVYMRWQSGLDWLVYQVISEFFVCALFLPILRCASVQLSNTLPAKNLYASHLVFYPHSRLHHLHIGEAGLGGWEWGLRMISAPSK